MSNQNLNVPQPVLEEHLLIEQNAPELTLTHGLKSRVMAECIGEIRKSRRSMRLRQFAITSVAACVVLGICLMLPEGPTDVSEGTAGTDATEAAEPRRHSTGTVRAGVLNGIAVDSARPGKSSGTGTEEVMEGINHRNNIMHGTMIPGL
ncbi:MAG TPA: hypothetical protein DCG12_02600 [Planctomycetaceae bacterium]|nr:hypothetical protein [Planctomycetaceae bacterium]